jgi:MFS transporter, DHA2 family, methylenomycin A resistance protein
MARHAIEHGRKVSYPGCKVMTMAVKTIATRDRWTLAALCLGWFIVIVDATIVNVALPTLAHELPASITDLQWVVDGYTVTFAGLLLSGGVLADRFGARRAYAGGLVLFCAASAACALAPGLAVLITARVAQGVGSALLVPACLALIQASYHDRDTRSWAIGIWATVGGLAGGSGPLFGGVLTDAFGWRALFWVNVPVGVVTLLLTRRYVSAGDRPEPRADDRRGLDLTGQAAGGVALLGLTAGAVEAGRGGWTAALPLSLLAIGVAGAIAFVLVERRVRRPMLPLSIFSHRELSAATAIGFAMNFSFYGLLFVEAIVLERRYGFSPLLTGLALLPQTGVIAVGSWLGGRATTRIGARIPMAVGMAVGAAGFLGLCVIGPHTPYVALVVPMLAAGFGISFCMPAATSAVVEAAPEGRAGIASGALNASRQVGGALGIALLGAFIASAGGGSSLDHVITGARIAFLIAAATYLAGLVLALSIPRHQHA